MADLPEELQIIVGVRDLPSVTVLPGSKCDYICIACHNTVWLAPSGQRKLEKRQMQVVCLSCFMENMPPRGSCKVEFPTAADLLEDGVGGRQD